MRFVNHEMSAGLRFGHLVTMGPSERRGRCMYWQCQCDCGRECWARVTKLRAGTSTHCGCQTVPRRVQTRSSRPPVDPAFAVDRLAQVDLEVTLVRAEIKRPLATCEIGALLGISRQRVEYIEQAAIKKLRDLLQARHLRAMRRALSRRRSLAAHVADAIGGSQSSNNRA